MSVDLDAVWADLLARAPDAPRRASFRFDPAFYRDAKPGLDGDEAALRRHWERWGRARGRHPNRYRRALAKHPDLDEHLRPIIEEPRLLQAFRDGVPGAGELAFEVMHLGGGLDGQVSAFSREHYLSSHKDVARSKADPLLHYLYHGMREGRASLATLRQRQHKGRRAFDPALPTCLIVTHEMSRTGAPIVALDLVREASETWNVVVLALRDGELLDRFRDHACEVVVTPSPRRDWGYLRGEALDAVSLAVLNSIAGYNAVEFLVAKEIPFVGYVHEYPHYFTPILVSLVVPLYADVVAFSSEQVRGTWLPRLDDIEFDVDRDSLVVPQRPVRVGTVGPDRLAAARGRVSALIGRDCRSARIVCGAGHVQIRKGTDIFAMTAQIMRRTDPDTVFVWIGDGLSREDLRYGAYLCAHLDAIGVGDPAGNLFFLPAGDAYPDVLAAADVMLVASRLDPLPNVAFDALEAGCQVVFFEGASGFSDEPYRRTGRMTAVEYGNPAAAAEAIRAVPRKEPGAPVGEASGSDQAGPPLFGRLVGALRARLRGRRHHVLGESPLDCCFLFSDRDEELPLRRLERQRIFGLRRRLFWRNAAEAQEAVEDSGSWVHERCQIMPYGAASLDDLPPFAVHVHAYYVEDLSRDLCPHPVLRRARRIVVTTDSERKEAAIHDAFGAEGLSPEVVVGPNRGRDVLPFLDLFDRSGAADDAIWCHLHQKKSIGSSGSLKGGDLWRGFLMAILLGQDGEASVAGRLIGGEGVGLVTAFDPYFIGWNGSRALLPKVAGSLPGPLPKNPLLFPVGNMFWIRREVVLAMKGLFGPGYPWPNEPVDNDGTEYHLIERLWPAVAASLGLRSVFVSDPSLKRGR